MTKARAALAAGFAVAMLAPSGAAVAGSDVVRDKTGDVSVVSLLSESDEVAQAHARRRGDITSVRTAYARGTITLTTRMREIPRSFIALAELGTSAGGRRYGVLASGRGKAAEVALYRGKDSETVLPCDGLTVRARPRQQTLVVRIPATCVGSPRWIRSAVAMTALSFPSPAELAWPGAFEDLKFFADVAGMAGMSEKYFNSSAARLPLGPMIRRN
ncbi:MAG TPA: hypothetical protein VGE38_13920 [Nocardioides sp.]|uniref:hypothetical protein n=1 Tax=Nocardioides sp. TaxID=35761 RepID=UPI002ED935C7